ncbi:hypothetical protein SAMN05421770_1011026 [Granulicella rosea]|uniref:Uncharacterized protein n=1 Tax=Granulicella rosea TaxID=474952 RepID=A0A239EKZ3_9BACT|nr:hypothetical protein [Granulicella rosea]SNS45061.1 hypothetical protein SAMN05421770_1011026 [Granulicella rosea]
MEDSRTIRAMEHESGVPLSGMFEVDGFGMVQMHGAAGVPTQLWLPFEPMPVQLRLM